MSNVLIGIIGVILFIGLAIAGAVYMGGLVLDGGVQRNAGIIVSGGQQTAVAVRMYQAKNRGYFPNSTNPMPLLISSGAMKATPINPFGAQYTPVVTDINGSLTTNRPGYVAIYLGQSEQAMKACIEIEIQNNHTDRITPAVMQQTIPFLTHVTPGRAGCHRNQGFFGTPNSSSSDQYLAYFPV